MSATEPVEPFVCFAKIDLSRPSGSERVRDFQPPYRTVWIYKCQACGAEHRVRAGAFSGKRAVPGVGAIRCGASLVKPVAS